jgi:hypothetical protein
MIDERQTARLHQVVAKQEIHDVLMRFCRGVDRLDEALLRSCYHADSYDDHGHFKGKGHDFAAYIVKSIAERAHHTTHSVANVLIELDNEDANAARTESYVLAYLRRRDADDKEWLDFFSGRYVDRFERREGDWRIAVRVVVHDWSASAPLEGATFPLPMDGFTQGQRGPSDLVYRI